MQKHKRSSQRCGRRWHADAVYFRSYVLCLLIGFVYTPHAAAQDAWSPFSSFLMNRNGFGLTSASVSTGWLSGLDQGAGLAGGPFDPGQFRTTLTGSATIGWGQAGERSRIATSYTPSYFKSWGQPGMKSVGHVFSFSADRRLSPKWSLSTGVSASYLSVDQILFSPTLFSRTVSLPMTLDDMANTLLTNPFTTDYLASALTGSRVLESPSRLLFLGNRVLTSEARTGMTYASSSRTSLTVFAEGIRMQPVSGRDLNRAGGNSELLPTSTTGMAGASLAHWLNPRTTVGVSVDASRSLSAILDTYVTSASIFAGRKLGMRWFAQVHGGPSAFIPIRQRYPMPRGAQFRAGGSLGYKRRDHTFLFAAERSLSDFYGLGSRSTITPSAAWNWTPHRSKWSVSANASAQQIDHPTLGKMTSWQASSQLVRRMRDFSMSFEYVYLYSGYRVQPGIPLSQHGLRLAFTWAPAGPHF